MKHSNLRLGISLALTALLFLAAPKFSYAGEEVLPIEGIVYESKDPAQSFAVIDGNLYQKGERYQSYEIIEVRQDRVLAKNASGKTSEHRITGGVHSAVAQAVSETPVVSPPRIRISNPADGETPKTTTPVRPQDLWEQFRKIFGNLDPAVIMNYVAEIAVMADLRNLYSASAAFAMMDGDGSAISLEKMIQQEMIDPAYKDGKRGYRYRVQSVRNGVYVYADPILAEEMSRHFMIDAWGNMRAEKGRAATEKSPLVQPPAWLRELIPKTPPRQTLPDDYAQEKQERNTLPQL